MRRGKTPSAPSTQTTWNPSHHAPTHRGSVSSMPIILKKKLFVWTHHERVKDAIVFFTILCSYWGHFSPIWNAFGSSNPLNLLGSFLVPHWWNMRYRTPPYHNPQPGPTVPCPLLGWHVHEVRVQLKESRGREESEGGSEDGESVEDSWRNIDRIWNYSFFPSRLP